MHMSIKEDDAKHFEREIIKVSLCATKEDI